MAIHRIFLSTLSLRRATNAHPETRQPYAISIHALLAESDHAPNHNPCSRSNFYPRSPCGERRFRAVQNTKIDISIHALLAESDSAKSTPEDAKRYFYPRSPCGERRQKRMHQLSPKAISIHALLAESDRPSITGYLFGTIFLSTLSLRRATTALAGLLMSNLYFYPRSPCGERRYWPCVFVVGRAFLSTLSLRRATANRDA